MIRTALRSAPPGVMIGRDDALRFVPWLIALMVYVATLASIGLLVLEDGVRAAENLLASRLTVQVPADASAARVQTVLAVLRQTSGARSAQLLTPAETSRLLQPWLGSAAAYEGLPVPRVIDVRIDPGAVIDIAKLKQQLAGVVPEVRLDDHRAYLAARRGAAHPLQGLLGGAIGAALLLVSLSAGFATGAALTARRSDIELLHLLGAADRDIARPYARRSLLHALTGAGIGALAVLATIAVLDRGLPIRPGAEEATIGFGDWRLWAVLVSVTMAAGVIAATSAWATVLRRLARLP
jgi:cell division transport system permease protein